MSDPDYIEKELDRVRDKVSHVEGQINTHERECAARWSRQQLWNKIIVGAIVAAGVFGPKIASVLFGVPIGG